MQDLALSRKDGVDMDQSEKTCSLIFQAASSPLLSEINAGG